jgi:hypothetical protein
MSDNVKLTSGKGSMSERINNRMKPSNDKGDHHVVQAVGPSACRTRYIMGAPNMPVAVAMGRMSDGRRLERRQTMERWRRSPSACEARADAGILED